jgi:SAM-dependent methyltransferase
MPTLQQWRKFYDGWAARDPRIASTGLPVADAEFARLGTVLGDWLGLRGTERVLDVGCASGTLTSRWADRAQQVVGIDFSPALAGAAQSRLGSTTRHFAAAEAAALPFAAGAFDAVVCFNVLLSLPDHDYAQRAVAELLRVLRPGGTLLLGSLPDARCQQRFFDVLLAEAPWWRRAGSRAKSWLQPRRPRRTQILWFDLPALAQQFVARGATVTLHDDPPFANYRHYRKTLVVRKPVEVGS